MRLRKFMMVLAALAFVAASSACSSLVQSDGNGGDQGGQQQGSGQGSDEQGQQQATEQSGQQGGQGQQEAAQAPEDPTLSLSIPKLDKQLETIPTGRGDNADLLMNSAAIHVYPTGFPWQKGSNVYLAGHVEGYQGTPSYKAFDGIRTLENGDEIVVTDANGKDYTYKVYEKRTVDPTELGVLDPVEGKSVVTLQTCEIVNVLPDGTPDYSNTVRTIVRGELEPS